jgi:hypothetical protein
MADVVISTPWGGLGDHLQFSTLPELYHAQGHTVWLHKDAPFRNQEIRKFVWGSNPYVAGFTDMTPNVGGGFAHVQHVTDSIVSDWEMAHGFGVRNHYPKLYYEPDTDGLRFKDTILIDLTCVSDTYDRARLHDAVQEIIAIDRAHSTLEHKQVVFTKGDIFTEEHPLEGVRTTYIHSLAHYADALSNCAGIITLMSGAAVLASTLKGDTGDQRIDVLMAQDKPIFKFRNADYTVL